jgi:hypothetical protein
LGARRPARDGDGGLTRGANGREEEQVWREHAGDGEDEPARASSGIGEGGAGRCEELPAVEKVGRAWEPAGPAQGPVGGGEGVAGAARLVTRVGENDRG